jgi:hypothetical protein
VFGFVERGLNYKTFYDNLTIIRGALTATGEHKKADQSWDNDTTKILTMTVLIMTMLITDFTQKINIFKAINKNSRYK